MISWYDRILMTDIMKYLNEMWSISVRFFFKAQL